MERGELDEDLKEATATINPFRTIGGDLSTDSDNNNEAGVPYHTPEEAALEDGPVGKYIDVQKLDANGDPAPGTHFVPMDVKLAGVTSSSTVLFDPHDGLRVWTGDVAGPKMLLADDEYTTQFLEIDDNTWKRFWVEALSEGVGTIDLWFDPTGDDEFLADTVTFTARNSHISDCGCSGGITTNDGNVATSDNDISGAGIRANKPADGRGVQFSEEALLVLAGNGIIVFQTGETKIWDIVDGEGYVPRDGVDKQGTMSTETIEGAVRYVMTDVPNGSTKWCFYADASAPTLGHLWKKIPPGAGSTQYNYDSSGQVTGTVSTTGNGSHQDVTYTRDTSTGAVTGMQFSLTPSGGSAQPVRYAEYAYYAENQFGGAAGDLKMVTIHQTDSNGAALETKYYRYYQAGEAHGFAHAVKYMFSNASIARMIADGINPYIAPDATVAPYADDYFEYDASGKVSNRVTGGTGCSLCGGQGSIGYTSTLSELDDAPNAWKCRTVESIPDGSFVTTFSNYRGQELLRDVWNGKTEEAEQHWITYQHYDDNGNLDYRAEPLAVIGYDDPAQPDDELVVYLQSAQGLIEVSEYYDETTATQSVAGGVAGYLYRSGVCNGTDGLPENNDEVVWQSETSYVAKTVTVDEIDITSYYTFSSTQYPSEDDPEERTTTYHYTFFDTTSYPDLHAPLVRMQETILPAVAAAEHGSGQTTSSFEVYDTRGRVVWTKDAAGFINYTGYDPTTGAVVKQIVDVGLSHTSDFLTGDYALLQDLSPAWGTPSGGGKHLITTTQVDLLGRTTKVTDPNGNVTCTVYNDAVHETRTYRGWNSSTHTATGPVEVSREDVAGNYSESLTFLWPGSLPYKTDGSPAGTESLTSSSAYIQSLSRSLMNSGGQATQLRQYFSLSGLTYSTARDLVLAGSITWRPTASTISAAGSTPPMTPWGPATRRSTTAWAASRPSG